MEKTKMRPSLTTELFVLALLVAFVAVLAVPLISAASNPTSAQEGDYSLSASPQLTRR